MSRREVHRRRPFTTTGVVLACLLAAVPARAAADDATRAAKIAPSLRHAVERARDGTLRPYGSPRAYRPGGRRLHPEEGRAPRVRVDAARTAQVYIEPGCPLDATLLGDLRAAGASIERTHRHRHGIVQARVPLDAVERLAGLPCVKRIVPPSYARVRTGSVTSEGDAILNADDVRAAPPAGFGLDGSGIRVAVISAGIRGLSAAQGSGDLPSVQVLDAGCTNPADVGCAEGTAMLEIVHDLAPGAVLGFYGPATTLDFCSGVSALQATFGADVLVDDLGFFDEPYFEDGLVAQCVTDAAAAGAVYVSAAGNDGDVHYQGTYVDSGDGQGSHRIGPGNHVFNVTGSSVLIRLQWANAFGASGDDYDLCLSTETPAQCAAFNTQQDGDDDPLEGDTFTCTGGCTLEVRRVAGAAQLLELFVLGGTLAAADRVPADGIFGHPAAVGAIAVGAIDAGDPGNDDIELFSSIGPATILFPAPAVRAKPEIAAVDGVAVTGAAGFPATFFGTSASAPHVAALAALVLDGNPALDPAGVADVLAAGAVDLGSPGVDTTFGAGRADGFASVALAHCGNGALDPGEGCDDGNTSDGDCCSAGCTLDAPGSSCEDGVACTAGDACDGAGACVPGTCQIGAACGLVCGVGLTCKEPTPGTCKCQKP
jgi:cysteine-rich repeat protein